MQPAVTTDIHWTYSHNYSQPLNIQSQLQLTTEHNAVTTAIMPYIQPSTGHTAVYTAIYWTKSSAWFESVCILWYWAISWIWSLKLAIPSTSTTTSFVNVPLRFVDPWGGMPFQHKYLRLTRDIQTPTKDSPHPKICEQVSVIGYILLYNVPECQSKDCEAILTRSNIT